MVSPFLCANPINKKYRSYTPKFRDIYKHPFMFYTYVLQSLVKDILYKGSTQNLDLRILQHNNGLVAFTSKFRPWKLIYYETFPTRAEAMAREKFFKSGKGREWLKKIIEKTT